MLGLILISVSDASVKAFRPPIKIRRKVNPSYWYCFCMLLLCLVERNREMERKKKTKQNVRLYLLQCHKAALYTHNNSIVMVRDPGCLMLGNAVLGYFKLLQAEASAKCKYNVFLKGVHLILFSVRPYSFRRRSAL